MTRKDAIELDGYFKKAFVKQEGNRDLNVFLQKMKARWKKHGPAIEEMEDEVTAIELEHASVDGNGNLVYTNGNLAYTREGMLARKKALRAYLSGPCGFEVGAVEATGEVLNAFPTAIVQRLEENGLVKTD